MFDFFLNIYGPVSPLHPPAGNGVERGSPKRFAGAQGETGVVPRAANRLANNETVGERPAIMGAYGADRKDILAPAGEQHGFAACMAGQPPAVLEIVECYSLPQIRASQLGGIRTH